MKDDGNRWLEQNRIKIIFYGSVSLFLLLFLLLINELIY